MSKKVLIVGGVAGGASAAARLRRLDESAEIIVFEKDEYISFANCGLPYYIGQSIKQRDKLLVQTPEGMKNRFNIDVRINSEVISVDTKNKEITVNSKEKGTYQESYDYLVLSPGARALKPNIPGIDNKKIFTLRNIPDTDSIKSYIDKEDVKSAIVVGGGYIGVEMAENLKESGLSVTLVQSDNQILGTFDSEMASFAAKELEDNGVQLVLNDRVESFDDSTNSITANLSNGNTLCADMVVLAIGVVPNTEFINNSGINLSESRHIRVNSKMETSVKNVYAVGDAVEIIDFVNNEKSYVPLAGPANKQGRICADNICGLDTEYKGTQGTSVLKIFDLTGASTGNNEKKLEALNIPYNVVYAHPQSHASYYPGATPISIKLIFDNDGKILGAQAFGYSGVEKRIDVIATTMRLGGTIKDLTELELSYAPPYSSAKDPVNMIGYIAENVLKGNVSNFLPKDLDTYNRENTILLDVRTKFEYSNDHIDGAINIPVDDLRKRINELDKNKEILTYCQVGLRGYIASRILSENGFKVKNLSGGYKTYNMSKFVPQSIEFDKSSKDDFKKVDMNNMLTKNINNLNYDKELDASGLCCPGPLMQVKMSIDTLDDGEILKVKASDPGFFIDIKSWCEKTNNNLLNISKDKGIITAFIQKSSNIAALSPQQDNHKDNKTIVVFSGDLDKAIASFIIANGAASMGKKVTLFFTFWGLNILRKPEKINVEKGFMDKMFGMMMPKGSEKLSLSKMNMMGMGSKMIRKVMKDKNISSLEDLIKSAINTGIELIACQMSMDVMGIKKEELIDGVKIGGVGYYLGEAEDSNVNLFI
ncbi:putative NADH oxidase [Gottschalkia purinilytica]|uniref:Putative NADH oxidase n=1 Tax=Gottschalkia purinilytica TaxID=1503 RepID=A0A0L0W850_GOTPU|nr:CoA-disulfide reductase [Gottschalkia purinilytica]KNF07724.1 putative NADH oxidase [Gottschalkia purinilytica]